MTVSSHKMVSAVRATWWLSAVGLVFSFSATVVLVRAMSPDLYAQYAAVLAIISLATLVFEGGANSGLTRYMAEAIRHEASGTFYRAMLWRRWILSAVLGAVLIVTGPVYARSTSFEGLAANPLLFVPITLIIIASLTRLLAHYGLLAMFEMRRALMWEKLFLVFRSTSLATVALFDGTLWHLVYVLLTIIIIESINLDFQLWRLIRQQRAALPQGLIGRAHTFGMVTIFDKSSAALGSGSVLLLVFARYHDAAQIALLALATELTGRVVSLTVLPMGNLVGPYLSQKSDDPAVQARAVALVMKLSSVLYCVSIGGAVIVLPPLVSLVYGSEYAQTVPLLLVLLIPTAFENWTRGSVSPGLLRAGHYRQLLTLNVIQAAGTMTAIMLVRHSDLTTALLAVGIVRSFGALLTLISSWKITDRSGFLLPACAVLATALCAFISFHAGACFALNGWMSALMNGLIYLILVMCALLMVARWDSDTLGIMERLLGARFTRFVLPVSDRGVSI